MGEPVRIHYLAEQMIRLAGKVPDKDIAIVYTGLRPGEKLFEELFHEHELYQQTRHSKIYLASPRAPFDGDLDALLRQTHAAVRNYDEARLLEVLRQLVPEFQAPHAEDDSRVASIHRIAG
jgi:FlaA1/EpsC-like NDP-sugar epimerase